MTRATSAAGCARWRGSARPGRSCRSSLPSPCSSSYRRPCRQSCRSSRSRSSRRPRASRWRRGSGPPSAGPGGHDCAAPWRATCVMRCSPGGRGRPSRSRRRSSLSGHAATFLIAARTAGATAPTSEMLPLALLVMQAAALPNVGGWGPREGVTAWAFAAAGLGAVARGRDCGRLWRDGVRRQPAGRRRPRGSLAVPNPVGTVARAAGPGSPRCLTAHTPC